MTTPFLSVSIAVLYFGWLWHDRRATRHFVKHPTRNTSATRKQTEPSSAPRLIVMRRRPLNLDSVAA